MKKLKLMLLATVPLFVACSGGGNTPTPSSSGGGSSDTGQTTPSSSETPTSSETPSSGDVPTSTGTPTSTGGETSSTGASSTIDRSGFVWTITFDSQGGSAVPSQSVKDGEVAVAPIAPTYEGYIFNGWYKDSYAVTPFDFSTVITADWTLYAGWVKSLDPTSSSIPTSSGTTSSVTPTPSDPYGPEGSELVNWYIVGEGALFSGWNTEGGVQMYSNPSSPYGTDLACILNMTFEVGDVFKITDGGSNWYGYIEVQTGTEYFEDTDPDANHNIGVVTAGSYDIYLNNEGKIYVSAHVG